MKRKSQGDDPAQNKSIYAMLLFFGNDIKMSQQFDRWPH